MLNITQPELIMLIGVPGSGKSTYIRNNFDLSKYVIISTDDILEQEAVKRNQSYSEVFKSYFKTADSIVRQKFRNAITNNKNIIWDQTNWSADKRKGILRQLPNYYKKGVFFQISLDTAKERVSKREKETGRHIPVHVLERMYNNLEVPTQAEGFDEIVLV